MITAGPFGQQFGSHVDQLCALFRASLSTATSAAAEAYCHEASCFLEWLRQRGLQVDTASDCDLKAYLTTLTERYQPSTAARKFSAIRRFYIVLNELGHLNTNPTISVPVSLGSYRSRTRAKPSTGLLEVVPHTTILGIRDRAIIGLLVFGLAPAQVVGLNTADVNIDAQSILLFERARQREIQPLDPDTFALIRRWIAVRQMLNPTDVALFISLHWTAGRSKPHQRISCRGLHDVLRRYMRQE